MSNNPTKDTTVKYVNKDFGSLKRDLMRYAQAHHSGAFQDFNESSPGMAILELQAYIGDILSYYMDQQFLELKNETARQLQNVEDFAKMRGYKPKGKRAARCLEKVIVEVPSKNGAPDLSLAPVLKAGSQLGGPNGITFETVEDLDFSLTSDENPAEIIQSRPADKTQPATHWAIRREVQVVAGETVTENIVVGDFKPWKRIELANPDVLEILDIFDSDGQQWYEVEYLTQNAVFDAVTNVNSDSAAVPYVLKLRSCPRRFIHDYSVAQNKSFLQFGSGQGLKFDDEIIPNVANMALPLLRRTNFTTFTLDPQNFLKTRSLGLVPSNTTLTVRYRRGGGQETNVPAQSIRTVRNSILEFKGMNLDPTQVVAVRNSIECINLQSSEGGGAAESLPEIKANAAGFHAAQARAVTKEDFMTHVLSMPSKFGRPEKVYVKPSDDSQQSSLDIFVLSKDENGWLTAPSSTLQNNIKTYLSKLRMMTEGVTILPGAVINIGVNFGVVIAPKYNRSEVLTNCLDAVKDHLRTDKLQIGQPIVWSEINSLLQKIDGVISVYNLTFKTFYEQGPSGLPYSKDLKNFSVEANMPDKILRCPPNAIFEVRHPDNDIVGESK